MVSFKLNALFYHILEYLSYLSVWLVYIPFDTEMSLLQLYV